MLFLRYFFFRLVLSFYIIVTLTESHSKSKMWNVECGNMSSSTKTIIYSTNQLKKDKERVKKWWEIEKTKRRSRRKRHHRFFYIPKVWRNIRNIVQSINCTLYTGTGKILLLFFLYKHRAELPKLALLFCFHNFLLCLEIWDVVIM